MTNTTQYQDIKNAAIDKLRDGVGVGNSCDLHHHLFNEDYFIIGTREAKLWINCEVFDVIQKIKSYEEENFGEVNTDFGDPEKVANMLAYILGEEVLQESETYQEKWDEDLTEDDLNTIADELENA